MPEVEEKPRKRVGRPPKAPEKGRRQNYTFRLSDQTRDQVIEAASQSGRSMSEELEWRIEESFRERQIEVLAKSLLNGSDKLYTLMSRVSGLISAIENYSDKNGNRLGSKDWDNHEPTRAAIRAGIERLVGDLIAPTRQFNIEDVRSRQNKILSEASKAGKLTQEDEKHLQEYSEIDAINQMVVLAKILSGILGGTISLNELQAVHSPQR
jgi:hypothetical protein